MLADKYVDVLCVNPELADQVWELWNVGVITDQQAAWAILARQVGLCGEGSL
jgi:hypothetical protein